LGVKATTKITALVILIGVLCGAFGEFVGKSVVEAIESGSWVSITAFTILGLIITAIVAYFMWKIPENFITQVLNKEEDQ
jgi:H+/Cl- antiporter ClcA